MGARALALQPRQCTLWLGELGYDAMGELLVARDLQFTENHHLTAGPARRLTPVADETYVFPRWFLCNTHGSMSSSIGYRTDIHSEGV